MESLSLGHRVSITLVSKHSADVIELFVEIINLSLSTDHIFRFGRHENGNSDLFPYNR